VVRRHDLIDGVILLPDNLFYNTTAAGVIVVLNKHKGPSRKDKIVLLNASKRVNKGKPKNYVPEDAVRPLAAAMLKGEPVKGEIAIITRAQAQGADYNLSPGRWIEKLDDSKASSISAILFELAAIDKEATSVSEILARSLSKLSRDVHGNFVSLSINVH
jgi:type I restriction enzyme M protein